MSLTFFAGTAEGKPFVAAQTLMPQEQDRAGLIVDTLTTRYGSRMPQFQKGWLARAIDPEISTSHVVEVLKHTGGNVVDVGQVPMADVESFLGSKLTAQAFENPPVQD